MQVSCVFCKKTQNANDCWCCIDRGNSHYECKSNPECDAIRKAQEEEKMLAVIQAQEEEKLKKIIAKEEKKKKRDAILREKEEEIRKAEALETAELVDWQPLQRGPGIFRRIFSFFSTEPLYTKVKTN